MARFSGKEIEETYRTHPLRKDTILRRVRSQRGSDVGLTELDLAEDPFTQISDQNHMGGLSFTRRLAERAGISSASRVLDLGCGLGGSARVLSWLYGCRVHGIDLSPERISDARDLTALVGLADRVTFECADVMAMPLPTEAVDVLWGQAAWSHLEHKGDFLHKWIEALSAGGCVAVEDVCLLRPPDTDGERDLLASLEDHWTSYVIAVDGPGGWKRLFEDCGLAIRVAEDRSEGLLEHFLDLKTGASRLEEPVSEVEQHAWALASQAAEAALIGYFRIVADRAPS